MKNLIYLSLISLFCFTACKKERLTANGNATTEVRTLNAFNKVQTSGSERIYVVYGNEYKVAIKGSSSLIPHFKSEITNGKLHLNYGHVSVQRSDLEVTVTMPDLKGVSLSGSSKIDILNSFPLAALFDIVISGSGSISLKEQMDATIANISISGAGNAELEALNCNQANVKISGSGDASLAVTQQLNANISGSGKIFYWGNPVVDSHISGSGKLVRQ